MGLSGGGKGFGEGSGGVSGVGCQAWTLTPHSRPCSKSAEPKDHSSWSATCGSVSSNGKSTTVSMSLRAGAAPAPSSTTAAAASSPPSAETNKRWAPSPCAGRRGARHHPGRLATREMIGQAEGILMEREHTTADQAYNILAPTVPIPRHQDPRRGPNPRQPSSTSERAHQPARPRRSHRKGRGRPGKLGWVEAPPSPGARWSGTWS